MQKLLEIDVHFQQQTKGLNRQMVCKSKLVIKLVQVYSAFFIHKEYHNHISDKQ